MASSVRTRASAFAVLGATFAVGLAACGAGGTGIAGGSTTSTPASTSFRTIPVTSTTTTAPAAVAASSGSESDAGGYTGETYTIRPGDAWPLIAKRVGVALDRLLAYNGATAKTPLYPGRKVRVPPPEGATTSPASPSDGASTPEVTAPEGFILHTVVVGDTWIGIAKKYGVDWKAVMEANGVTPEVNSKAPLTVGGQIKVPKKG